MAARIGACSLSSLNSPGRSYHLDSRARPPLRRKSVDPDLPRYLWRCSLAASRDRPRWSELPLRVRGQISELAGGRVVAAENCEGGFSPGFASQLTLVRG